MRMLMNYALIIASTETVEIWVCNVFVWYRIPPMRLYQLNRCLRNITLGNFRYHSGFRLLYEPLEMIGQVRRNWHNICWLFPVIDETIYVCKWIRLLSCMAYRYISARLCSDMVRLTWVIAWQLNYMTIFDVNDVTDPDTVHRSMLTTCSFF